MLSLAPGMKELTLLTPWLYACETLPTFVGFKTSNFWYDGLVDVAAVRILVHGKRPGGDQWILTGRGNNHMSNRLIVALTLSH